MNKTESETENEGCEQWDDFRRCVSCNWRSMHIFLIYNNIAFVVHDFFIFSITG